MAIDGLGAVQSETSRANTATKKDVMGKEQFMTLLVAQLQNQDPLNPMDSTGFTAQLAQFSSLEQLQNVNSNLSDISATQAALNNAQAVSFIGKTVSASGSQFEVNNGQTAPLQFKLNADAEVVQVGIYDAAGEHLRTLEGGRMSAGEQSIDWDGADLDGNKVPDGIYNFEILAVDADKQVVDTTAYSNGKVTGVNYKNGTPYLLANQIEIPLSSVISVAEPVDVE